MEGGRCVARPEMAVCVCVCMWCLPGESGGMRIEIVFKEPKRGKERKLRAETADGRRWAVSRRGPRGRTRSSQGRRIMSNECSSARQKMRNFKQLRDGCRAFIDIIMGPEARQAGNCVARRTMCQCLTSGLTWCEGKSLRELGGIDLPGRAVSCSAGSLFLLGALIAPLFTVWYLNSPKHIYF